MRRILIGKQNQITKTRNATHFGFFRTLVAVAFLISVSSLAEAYTAGGQTITLDGRLTNVAGDAGLIDASVVIDIKIYNPLGTCVLYEEHQTVDTTQTDGRFTILVGSSTGNAKRTGSDVGNPMVSVFSNYGTILGGSSCSYTPATGDTRMMRVTVAPSTTGTIETLSPDTIIDQVPNSLVAESLQGLDRDHVLAIDSTSFLSQANVANIFSSTNYPALTALLAGSGNGYVTAPASGGAKIPSVATAPASPTAGQIWFSSSAGAFQYYNGTAVQTLGVAGSGISSLNVGSSLTSNGVASTAVGSGATLDLVNSGVSAGTYSKVTVNAKGLVTYGTGLSEGDIPTLLTPGKVSGSAITSGTIGGTTNFYSSGNVTAQMVSSGVDLTRQIQLFDPAVGSAHKITISAPTLTNDYSLVFPTTVGSFGYALTTDGSGNLSWSNVASNSLPGLASGRIWVGNSSGVATAVTPYGDINLSIAGSATVTQLQGYPVSAVAPTLSGQILRWNGTAWAPNSVAMSDLRSTVTGTSALTSCTSSQTLVFNSVTDSLLCSNVAIANTQVAWGSTGANLVFAGPSSGGAASPTFRSLTAADFPAGTVSQWNTVSSTINYLTGFVGIGTATPQALLDVYGTGAASAMLVPRDTTTARPTGINGMLRYNTTNAQLETYSSGAWAGLATSASGGGASQWTTSGSNIYYGSGNVGIGTANPGDLLAIQANIGSAARISIKNTNSSGSADAGLVMSNDTGAYGWLRTVSSGTNSFFGPNANDTWLASSNSLWLMANATNSVGFTTNSVERMRINPTGLVGIGTNSPTSLLHTFESSAKTTAYTGVLHAVNNTSSTASVNKVGMDIESTGAWSGTSATNTGLVVNATGATTNYAATFSGGNVGVGTTSPQAILDVNGSGTGQSAMLVPRDSTAARPTGINGMLRYNTTNAQLETYSSGAWAGLATGASGGGSYLPLAGGTLTGVVSHPVGSATAPAINFGDATTGLFSTGTGNLSFATSSTNRMIINSSGLVGIGTPLPDATSLLDVNGKISTPHLGTRVGGLLIDTAGNGSAIIFGSSYMTIASGGFVGIGTTSPQAILDVNGSGTAQSAMLVPRDSTAARPTGINGMLRYNTTSNAVETFANGAWNSVATSASGGGASQWTTSGSNIYYGSGNVGIGTTTPNIAAYANGTFLTIAGNYGGTPANNRGGLELANLQTPASNNITGDITFTQAGNNGSTGVALVRATTAGSGGANGFGGNLLLTTKQDNVNGTNVGITINQSGNVGIGTTVPNAALEVAGNLRKTWGNTNGTSGNTSTYWQIAANDGSANWSELVNSNGTTSPTAVSEGAGFRRAYTPGLVAGANIYYQQYAAPALVGSSQTWKSYLEVDAKNSYLDLMSGGGNVGIGTTSPQAILDIYGTGSASAMIVPRASSASRPTGVAGMIRYNTDNSVLEMYNGSLWTNLSTSASGASQWTTSGTNIYFNSTGNVGIGVSPTMKLVVQQTANDGTDGIMVSAASPGGVASFYHTGAASARIRVGTTDGLSITNTGSVGVGTMAPTRNLEVGSTGSAGAKITAGGTGQWAELTLMNSNTSTTNNKIWGIANNGTTDNLQFRTLNDDNSTNPQVVMSLNRAGNVGVGTTSPSALLTVSSAAQYAGIALQNGSGSNVAVLQGSSASNDGGLLNLLSNAVTKVQLNANGNSYINGGSLGIGTATPNRPLTVYGSGSSFGIYDSNASSNGLALNPPTASAGSFGQLDVGGANDLRFNTNSAERFRITSTGNVGVGTTSPQALLDVYGTGTASAIIVPRATAANRPTAGVNGMIRYATDTNALESYINGAWTNLSTAANGASQWTTSGSNIYYNSTGNVGIGTATPSASLDVYGSTAFANNSYINFRNSIGSLDSHIYEGPAGFLNIAGGLNTGINFLSNANVNLLSITSSGNVGIGTTNPANALDVNGAISTSFGHFISTAASGNLVVDAGPVGSIFFRADSALGNTSGFKELMYISSGGNVGVGTTSPGTALELNANNAGATTSLLTLRNSATGTSTGTGILFGSGIATRGAITEVYDVDLQHKFNFGVGPGYATPVVTMTAGGNVGVGTTSPQAILDVNGSGTSQSAMIVPRDSTAMRPTGINGMLRYNTTLGKLEAFTSSNWQTIDSSGGATGAFVNNGNAFGAAAVLGTTDSNSLALVTGNSTRLTISSSGNVGVGNTSPSSLLQVTGPNRINAVFDGTQTVTDSSNQNTLLIASTFAPTSTTTNSIDLSIFPTMSPPSGITITNGIGQRIQSGAQSGSGTVTNGYGLWVDAPSYGSNKYAAYFGGNVGVGTTSPILPLQVNATGGYPIAQGSGAQTNGIARFYDSTNSVMLDVGGAPNTAPYGMWLQSHNIGNAGVTALLLNPTGGGVSLGTTSSANELDVSGGVAIGTYAGTAGSTNGLVVSGSVGVGTTSPQAILDVNGSGTSQSAMLVPRDSTAMRPTGINGMLRYNTTNAQLETYSSGAWAGLATGAAGSGSSQWTTSGANVYYSAGNVGIGTTSPTASLQVVGGGAPSINVSSPSVSFWSLGGATGAGQYSGIAIAGDSTLVSNSSSNTIITNENGGKITFATGATVGGDTAKLTILNGGNVGLGTTSPAQKLHVNGNAEIDSTLYLNGSKTYLQNDGVNQALVNSIGSSLFFNSVGTADSTLAYDFKTTSSNNSSLRILNNGNVGVGTTSPQAILDVNGTGASQSAMLVPRDSTAMRPTGINGMLRYNTTNAQLETYSSGAWAGLATGSSGGGSSQWTTSGSNIYYGGSGNVGIGTTAPDSVLNVSTSVTGTQAPPTGTQLHVTAADSTPGRVLVDTFGTANPVFAMRAARGTAAAPSAVQATDILGVLAGYGYGAASYSAVPRSRITFLPLIHGQIAIKVRQYLS